MVDRRNPRFALVGKLFSKCQLDQRLVALAPLKRHLVQTQVAKILSCLLCSRRSQSLVVLGLVARLGFLLFPPILVLFQRKKRLALPNLHVFLLVPNSTFKIALFGALSRLVCAF